MDKGQNSDAGGAEGNSMNEAHVPVVNLMVGEETGQPQTGLIVQIGAGRPPHYSEALYRLYCIEDTTVEAHFEDRQLTLKQRQLLTLSPGERIDFDEKAVLRSCAFHHNFFCVRVKRNEVFCDGVVFNRLTGFPVVQFPENEWGLAKSRFDELAHILEADSLFKPEHAVNALRSLLLHAADCKIRFSEATLGALENVSKVSDLVSRFQDLVEGHYAEHRDVAFYADELGVTDGTLNRHVKLELGQTAKQVAQERLAIEARVALRSGERSIKDVAIDLGFQDPLYFSRFFKKQFGAAPTQYFTELT